MDLNHYTQPLAGEVMTVKIAEFRGTIEHLERLCSSDYHACVSAAERSSWAARARRVGSELINMQCKRATEVDMIRRERAIDRSATLLSKIR